ncbi:MAG TPA: hypothetical protein VFT79_13095 [Solirubrobacterales bacterium]|nr:hypothetical protein [Solirubrobacterales bacterium]
MGRLRANAPALVVALVLGLVLGGGAVAAVSIPDNSIGWNKLTVGVQKRILGTKRLPPRPIRAFPGPQGEPGAKGEPGPMGPSGAIEPRCEIVEGDCLIYGNEFWRLQAAYEPYELDVGVYPAAPSCLKAQVEGEPLACTQALTYLYPDGTLGTDSWLLDPEAPKGWRFFSS